MKPKKSYIKRHSWVFKWGGSYLMGIAGGLTVLSFGEWKPLYGWLFLAIFIVGLACFGMMNLAE